MRHRRILSSLALSLGLCAAASPALALVAVAPEDARVLARPLPRLVGGAAPARIAGSDAAVSPEGATPGEDAVAIDPVDRRRTVATRALARLAGDAGAVQVRWNAWTGLPHRVWGAGLAVTAAGRRLDDAGAAEDAARGLLVAHPDLWAGDDSPAADGLALAKARRVGATWFLVFQQRHRGVDVEGGRVDLRLRDDGTVVLLGSDWFPAVDVPVVPRLPLGVADARARAELGFDPGRDRALGGTTVIVPLPGADGSIDYRLAHKLRHRLDDPPALWVSWIDATTGETLAREDVLRRVTLTGTVTGLVHPTSPFDPFLTLPFRDEIVRTGNDSTLTTPNGAYTLFNVIPNTTVTVALRGPFLEVIHAVLPEAVSFANAPSSGPLNFNWTAANSDTSERDAFYHGQVAHTYVKAIEPAFTDLDYRVPCTVNIGSQCNAFWDGIGVNFYRWGIRPSDGKACANTATIADVVYHEYGHGRTQFVFEPFEPSGAMHEGMSDYYAATITNQPLIGRGFFGPGTNLRTTANTQRIDFAGCAGEGHCVGNAISGALWDLRGRLVAAAGAVAGVRLADSLFHFSGYGGATWHDDWLLDLLVVDDDDGTLLNGTPHSDDICAAFTLRGFSCPTFTDGVWFVHTPLPDANPGPAAFPVQAQVGSFGGAFDSASPTLTWRVNGGILHDVAMTPLGGGQYQAAIPAMPAGGDVEYFLTANDFATGPATSPPGAPATMHAFHAGTLQAHWTDDFQTDRGWTGSIAGATTGRWMRVDPNGTSTGGIPDFFFSPEDDHTPGAGTFCFVTGDTTAGLGAGHADVDDGCVTLISPLIDLSSLDNARLEYWRWYVDETRLDDTLRVAVSANGGASWVEVERVFLTEEGWQVHAFDIERYVPLTSSFRLRVTACDGGGGSLAEAALDDVLITTRRFGVVAAGDPAGDTPAVAFLGRPVPNPVPPGGGTSITFDVPAGIEGAVRLEIVDARGRIVRTLAAGLLPPGRHVRRWNGEDDRGARVGAGVYFVRFATPEGLRREKVIRLD